MHTAPGDLVRFRVEYLRRVQRQLDRLSDSVYLRIDETIQELRTHPRPQDCVKITDQIYRVRVGDYRIIYQIDDTNRVIRIGWVGRRRENTYRAVERLFS